MTILHKGVRKLLEEGRKDEAWALQRESEKPRARIRAVNPEASKKRRGRYAKALRSAHWKALRKQVFEEQGGLCICGQEPMTICDHLTYSRLGHELREDVQGLGDRCNAIETTSKRANWTGDRRGAR